MQWRAPDAAQRAATLRRGALLIRGPWPGASVGPGSAEQRKERCTASGTRHNESAASENVYADAVVTPPSTTMVWPVMKLDASLPR
jgi:hypothetical protein